MGELNQFERIDGFVDMHTHSRNSHDARFPIAEMCEAGVAAGVKIMAVTDHCDTFLCRDDENLDIYTNIAESHREIAETQEIFGDKIKLLRGIEIGEGFWFPEKVKELISSLDYDVIIGSVHAVESPLTEGKTGMQRAFSQIAWENVSEEEIADFFDRYFDDLLRCVTEQDMDIMAHLGCVKAYILRKKGLNVDLHPYEGKIERVFEKIIERKIAMEVNTSPKKDLGILYPDEWIIRKYREMGGELITVASDAHHPTKVGHSFSEISEMLREMGFEYACYYENRVCRKYAL